MADITNVLNAIWPILGLFNLLIPHTVTADYCEFDLCDIGQYCCGDNKCCTKTLEIWFFWAGILLVIFALAVAAGVRYTRNRHATYVLVATHPVDDVEINRHSFK
ncbi:hypothetical protein PPYR_03083 [Photinus pyralis]|uniref:Vesicular, overexpressed in cancer, prosurvival protein 1 n=1 Tax=Photinus pyralis TaxID=7054 RepID=A0A1Y1MQM1_PHOPY|nr:uncharacterized protein LOC116161838 [Photinus pyralis]XP_031331175.1 uncharacterized protein LOC116161842 [Photinus pyralis]KAB0791255.1 hypothetical protein PPYR_03055 [Photinus pyralis]KAB0791283.1 hypothetical protein PPYR_03083 [Photinus pyralis]